MKFKHIIGKSTFKQGFAVPKTVYPYLTLPEKGYSRDIQLLFGNNQVINAKLYRINNSVGHLQVRYDGQSGTDFKNWLIITFHYSWNDSTVNCNEYIEITILYDGLFQINEFPLIKNKTLFLKGFITHKIIDDELISNDHFIEIIEAIRSVKVVDTGRQMYYNGEIEKELLARNWLSEQKVVNDNRIRLRCDFRKDDFQLEVEFGNARDYYQNLVKFVMSYNAGFIKVGGLLVPTTEFSKYLCHLGHLSALEKSGGRKSQYSGMMNFNKAALEFEYIKNIFNIPFFIIGISRNE